MYLGSASGLTPTAVWTMESNQAGAQFGYSVASAGDVNGDGFSDVVVGAYYYTNGETREGAAFVYLGNASGLATTAAWAVESNQANAFFGSSVASAGDVNGDGYGDVVVGAGYYTNGATGEGAAFVYLGSASGLTTTAAWTAESDRGSARFGSSVASAGDVNGDGYGDVAVGGGTFGPTAFVYLGSALGLTSTAAWTVNFGGSVASAGDVNGDGFGDVVVGAEFYGDGGAAFVYVGSASGLAMTAAWGVEQDQASARFGASVASAGDVNGDGYGDVVVGTGISSSLQAAFLYLGNTNDGTTPLSRAGQARQPGTTTPIPPGLVSTSPHTFDVSMAAARTSWGFGRVKLQVEVKPLGQAFDGTDLVTSSMFHTTGLTGAAIQEAIPGLTGSTGYHWRARALASPAEGRSQGWGPWFYGGLSGNAAGAHVFTSSDPLATNTLYADTDGDGYGGATFVTTSEPTLPGFVNNNTDCDDGAPAIHPNAMEICDNADIDENCDGQSDDSSAAGQSTWHLDADGDGFGGAITTTSCDRPVGYVDNLSGGDCDDSAPAVHPNGAEICDDADIDEDCDGQADDSSAAGQLTWYLDGDDDGFGGTTAGTSCERPEGYTDNNADCDDADPAYHPGASEDDCNDPADYNCDGASGRGDLDGDGFDACQDCDDNNIDVHPNAVEVCDPLNTDEDCDGQADDSSAAGQSVWYLDADGDGAGGATQGVFCDRPPGYADISSDCNDNAAGIHPSAIEICDDVNTDEDCDELADDADPSSVGQSIGYVDGDGDGFGGTTEASFCDLPAMGYSANSDDCDDASASVHPNAIELCDPLQTDEDCDRLVDNEDDSVTGQSMWYADGDRDGFGRGVRVASCEVPNGYVGNDYDCDDSAPAIKPGATEIPGTGLDEDCDGQERCFDDADDDGYLDLSEDIRLSADSDCADPREGTDSDPTTDCDDAAAARFPGADEITGNGIDENCDGQEICFEDADNDGYLDASGATRVSTDPDCDDPYEGTSNDPTTDCVDDNAAIHPDMAEVCDPGNVDEDCDGAADDADAGAQGKSTWYRDEDRDGWGAERVEVCDPFGDVVAQLGDCDDTSPTRHPGASELVDSGVDEDCDEQELCFLDNDDDGFLKWKKDTIQSDDMDCDDPREGNFDDPSTDCNDGDPGGKSTHPGAVEPGDDWDVDNDCNGIVEICGFDEDGDGWFVRAAPDDAGTCVDPDKAVDRCVVGDPNDQDRRIGLEPGNMPCDAESVGNACDAGRVGSSIWWGGMIVAWSLQRRRHGVGARA